MFKVTSVLKTVIFRKPSLPSWPRWMWTNFSIKTTPSSLTKLQRTRFRVKRSLKIKFSRTKRISLFHYLHKAHCWDLLAPRKPSDCWSENSQPIEVHTVKCAQHSLSKSIGLADMSLKLIRPYHLMYRTQELKLSEQWEVGLLSKDFKNSLWSRHWKIWVQYAISFWTISNFLNVREKCHSLGLS